MKTSWPLIILSTIDGGTLEETSMRSLFAVTKYVEIPLLLYSLDVLLKNGLSFFRLYTVVFSM